MESMLRPRKGYEELRVPARARPPDAQDGGTRNLSDPTLLWDVVVK